MPRRRGIVRLALAVGATALLAAGGVAYYRAVFVQPVLRLSGVVSADRIIITPQVSGAIRELLVDEGSWVEQGDRIALLERDELEAEEIQQRAKIKQLAAKRNQNREMVRLETDRGQSEIATAEAQVQLAESKLEEARVEERQRRKDVEYNRALQRDGLSSKQAQEQIETELQVATARVRSALDQLGAAQADLEYVEANRRQIQVMGLDVEQTDALLEQAEAELARIAARLEHTEIRAPRDGLVSLRVANQGEVVKPGDPIVTILELNDVWVRAEVEESYVGRLQVGQTLAVELASGETVEGTITAISAEAEFATQRDVSRLKRDIRTFAIKVAVPNPDHRVHPGTTAYVLLP